MVSDRQSAHDAIQNIIQDGEGTPTGGATSHYAGFLAVRQRYFEEGRFDAARRVPRNPVTRPGTAPPEAVTLIKTPVADSLRSSSIRPMA